MGALSTDRLVAVIGAGTMGTGIAQVAASAGHRVLLYDAREGAAAQAVETVAKILGGSVAKGRLSAERRDEILGRLAPCRSLDELAPAGLIIEAVIEDLAVKRELFNKLVAIASADAILATNTSALSIAAIAQGLPDPSRLVGMHFFNPAAVMPLVEVVSALATAPEAAATVFDTAAAWGKTPVHAKATPGFIVNRCARSFYAEAWRLLGERVTDPATLDAVTREAGGFRMGPCELMDLIGHDISFAVTCAIFDAYFGDPRYRPSLLQREMVESGRLGRKTGRGFFAYGGDAAAPQPVEAPSAPPPSRVAIEGDLGVAAPLVARLAAAGIPHVQAEAGAGGPVIVLDGAVLRLTDGRTATQRAAEGDRNLVLFDLALDYAKATRIAIASADQAEPSALAAAAGFFQALGIKASPVDDSPGLVVMRTVAMLVNEAMDAVQAGVAEAEGIDLAMMKGVNYPRGPLAWAKAIGLPHVLRVLENLRETYGEDRYRVAPRLRRLAVAEER